MSVNNINTCTIVKNLENMESILLYKFQDD